MYIELIRQVVETGASDFAALNGETVPEVLKKIRGHIDHTSEEHQKSEPNIDYADPLCRLGYLFRHGAANATLFERVLDMADEVWPRKASENPQTVSVCALGGGPGTELLGIAKYLKSHRRRIPSKISFALLDNVPQWAETWQQISQRVSEELSSSIDSSLAQPPVIAPSFIPLDVVDATSYKDYAYMFREADIVVCNYLFSENKTQLKKASGAVQHLSKVTPPSCAFVVIDRCEYQAGFLEEVVGIFDSVFEKDIRVMKQGGILDANEQATDFGDDLLKALGYPRIRFRTAGVGNPTVFWFVAKRREG